MNDSGQKQPPQLPDVIFDFSSELSFGSSLVPSQIEKATTLKQPGRCLIFSIPVALALTLEADNAALCDKNIHAVAKLKHLLGESGNEIKSTKENNRHVTAMTFSVTACSKSSDWCIRSRHLPKLKRKKLIQKMPKTKKQQDGPNVFFTPHGNSSLSYLTLLINVDGVIDGMTKRRS